MTWTRRNALKILASPLILAQGCRGPDQSIPFSGEIVGADRSLGHRLRSVDSSKLLGAEVEELPCLIVGAGIAGLASAWQLKRLGFEEFRILELEKAIGGTARGGKSSTTGYPWGAHYLPAPSKENRDLIQLLEEMGVVTGRDADGNPEYFEEHLCRDPKERLFWEGKWQEELFPESMTEDDRKEWDRFRQEVDRWVAWRDEEGKRPFCLPISQCSTSSILGDLDRISMRQWLDEHRFQSRLVEWEVDYACRDDYGTTPETTSAWAGLFYFASRIRNVGEESQPFLTWPEGNARIVHHLAEKIGPQIATGLVVLAVIPEPSTQTVLVYAMERDSERIRGYRVRRLIFASPQFIAGSVIEGYRSARSAALGQFSYAPWLVANLHLRARPEVVGFPMAWDNVLYDSRGLGYVVATHQTGIDHGPTVITYYLALCDQEPKEARQWLEQQTWESCVRLVLDDLEKAHPEIRSKIERMDIMLWGHAMIRPTPRFCRSQALLSCREPFHGIHFAHTDLSGVALLEEAFFHGVRAANEVVEAFKGPA